MEGEPKVFLVDDDPGVRTALGTVLESEGLRVESFESAESFLSRYREGQAGCLVLDLRLDGISGIQLLEKLGPSHGLLRVIMISGHGDVRVAVQSMKLGAVDFLPKPLDQQMLIDRVKGALAEARAHQAKLAQAADARARLAVLTPRERELLQMICEGKSSKQIAAETGLSGRTVSNHRGHMLVKTGAENTAHLVRLAMLAGIIRG